MKKNSRFLIFASGDLSIKNLLQIKSSDFIIGVDRASYWLIQNHITPDIAIGDFDSVTPKELKIIRSRAKEIISFPCDKNFTDLELAVNKAIALKPKSVKIYGSLGTRLDHSLVSLQFLEKLLQNKISASIINDTNKCFLCNSVAKIKKNKNYPYLSILPISKNTTLSISGCKYPLKKTKIARGLSLCVSNQIMAKSADITIHHGLALVIQSRD
jgi:thiamine pyrophosphokinase